MTVPTITKMVKVYVDSATVERLKCGRPGEGTVKNTLAGVKVFRRWLNERRERLGHAYIGFDEDFPLVSIVTPKLIHAYLADLLKRGVKPVTAMSYLNQFQQLFAKWVRPYYEDRGWKVAPFPSLGGRPKPQRYQRPSKEQLAKVKRWYEDLSARAAMELNADRVRDTRNWAKSDVATTARNAAPTPQSDFAKVASSGAGGCDTALAFSARGVGAGDKATVPTRAVVATTENAKSAYDESHLRSEKQIKQHSALSTHSLWFIATMMLEFGMRNSDVLRLTRENFVEKDGKVYLNYTPHKTANSSGRVVKWPVHEMIWNQIVSLSPIPLFNDDTFRELNRQMRGLGFGGAKGAYELRKICVDHVYQKYGAEMATSISGDDIKTIIRYYADPAQPNVGEVRIVDLL